MMKLTTNQLQTTLTQASQIQKNNENTKPKNDINLNNLDVKNIYIGRDNKVHVSNSGFAAQSWLGKIIYGVKATGAQALETALKEAGIDTKVSQSAMTKISGASLFGVKTFGEAISKAALEQNQKFDSDSRAGLETTLHSLKNKLENVERKRSDLEGQQKEKNAEMFFWDNTTRTVTLGEQTARTHLSKDVQNLKLDDRELFTEAESLREEIETIEEKLKNMSSSADEPNVSENQPDVKIAFGPSGDIIDRQMADEIAKTYRYLMDIRP
jgi:hypothetical protein